MGELIMTEQRVKALIEYIRKGYSNKFTKNASICSFYLLCPKNGQPMQITYNGNKVGYIENGKMYINDFDKKVWRASVYKFDLLHEIKDKFEGTQDE